MHRPRRRANRNERRRESVKVAVKVAPRSRNQNTATLENFQIYNLSFLGINHLAQGRGDLESATLARVCFRGVFSRIFQGRTMGFESPARMGAAAGAGAPGH